jgi:Protein of unknown function (DUF3306)
MSDDETFAGRWSRRKQAHRAGLPPAPAEPPALTPPVEAAAGANAGDVAKTEEPPPDLPPIDSLTKDSDYAPFLRANVPEALRNLALRKLWLSDPAFSAMDVLDHHNLDYTAPPLTEAIKTVYQLGRGMVGEDEKKPDAVDPSQPAPPPANTNLAAPPPGEGREAAANLSAAHPSAAKPSH